MENKKKKIFFLASKEETKEEKELLKEIREAKVSFEAAKDYFLYANEPNLIDYAIYMENATRIRYMYLLKKAREKGIKIGTDYLINQSTAI
jgi:aryl carrier-like protein